MLSLLIVAPFALIFFLIMCALYFVPSLIAFGRKVPNAGSVLVVNIFLGWSLIGWVIALAMAVRTKRY